MPKHATQKKSIRRIPNAHVIAVVIDAAAVLFFTSCERKNPAATGSEVTMQPPSAASRSSAPEASIEMVKLPGGRFLMGDPNEIDAPPHEVAVSSFYIDKYLVTQEQYQKTMNANPSR